MSGEGLRLRPAERQSGGALTWQGAEIPGLDRATDEGFRTLLLPPGVGQRAGRGGVVEVALGQRDLLRVRGLAAFP